ncbi:cytochrome d ubiquinol oxidase subunit II [Pseudacidobacterium ailaaui]|jgi:cytochrome d ubiquinol oxidase subunit II|uniref:cytochrome d ubiquinol oxidase subunit II n=1 Tax=Pseudacidobacterium ailaaui TaxID=1382359 RepID=UPI0005D1EC1B|nr:cytochrome d ubiquinol oxidase subunit II [Pseudacidobacterium ailaaui]
MGAIWFWIVALMIAAYVVLDGFDIGVGILYPFLARDEQDRGIMMRSIGPVWDGNEVWLLAGGGTLYFAFPLLYASAFSGFYLPLMIVLWLLIMRGASIELRAHVDSDVWRSFFDGLFFVSSSLLAIFFGAALANVIRGVPLGEDNYFFLPLWTNWRVGPQPGILDWYTVIGGVVALVALATHGALYLAMKATDELEIRALKLAKNAWIALCAVTLISLPATIWVRPVSLTNYQTHPVLFVIPLAVLVTLAGMRIYTQKGKVLAAFLSSCGYLIFMLVGAAVGLYPVLLPSSSDPDRDITVAKALSGLHALHVGLVWWSFGMLLALAYFVVTYWMFRGKISVHEEGGYGH